MNLYKQELLKILEQKFKQPIKNLFVEEGRAYFKIEYRNKIANYCYDTEQERLISCSVSGRY